MVLRQVRGPLAGELRAARGGRRGGAGGRCGWCALTFLIILVMRVAQYLGLAAPQLRSFSARTSTLAYLSSGGKVILAPPFSLSIESEFWSPTLSGFEHYDQYYHLRHRFLPRIWIRGHCVSLGSSI